MLLLKDKDITHLKFIASQRNLYLKESVEQELLTQL
jgi:hypothetical protein